MSTDVRVKPINLEASEEISSMSEKIATSYNLTYRDVIDLLAIIDNHSYKRLEIELGDFKLSVEKGDNSDTLPVQAPLDEIDKHSYPQNSPIHPANANVDVDSEENIEETAAPSKEDSISESNNYEDVKTPITGVYYRSPSPEEPPFVEIGSEVKAGDQVGIVEVMKVFNTIKAPCDGIVKEILVENEDLVETNQSLMKIEPIE